MCLEEFRLGFAAVRTFAVPPVRAVAIEISTTGLSNRDIGSRDCKERPGPGVEGLVFGCMRGCIVGRTREYAYHSS